MLCLFLSSRAVTAVLRFPWRGSRDLGLSLEAFRRGFPTRLSHRAVPRATLVCVDPRLESEAVQGKQFPWNGLRLLQDSGNVARPWSSSHLSCGERLQLRCDRKAGNSFPTTQGKDPSSRARRRKRGSSGYGRDSRASSRV